MEAGTLPQLERIGLAIGRDLPELGECGNDIQVLVESRQAVIKLLHEHDIGAEDRLCGVQRPHGLKERVAKDAALHGNLHDVVDAAAARTERLFLDEASGESRHDKKAQEASGNEPGAFSAHGSRSGARRLRI